MFNIYEPVTSSHMSCIDIYSGTLSILKTDVFDDYSSKIISKWHCIERRRCGKHSPNRYC